jgi:uncharacterized membrane protein
MLKYYLRLLREAPALLLTATSRVNATLTLIAFALLAFTPWLVATLPTTKDGPAAHIQAVMKAFAMRFPPWWPLVPILFLAFCWLLKANYDLYTKVEKHRNRLRTKLNDRAKRQKDAAELVAFARP